MMPFMECPRVKTWQTRIYRHFPGGTTLGYTLGPVTNTLPERTPARVAFLTSKKFQKFMSAACRATRRHGRTHAKEPYHGHAIKCPTHSRRSVFFGLPSGSCRVRWGTCPRHG